MNENNSIEKEVVKNNHFLPEDEEKEKNTLENGNIASSSRL